MFARNEVSVLLWAEEEMAAGLCAVWRDLIYWWLQRSKVVPACGQAHSYLIGTFKASFSMVSAAGSSSYLGREEGEEENGSCSALLLSQGRQQ